MLSLEDYTITIADISDDDDKHSWKDDVDKYLENLEFFPLSNLLDLDDEDDNDLYIVIKVCK